MIKSLTLLKKKASLTRDEFLRHWLEKHGSLAAKIIPGRKTYIQCHPIPINVPGVEFEIDGIAEFWWDDLKAYQNYITWRQSNEAKPLIEDEKRFIDMSQMKRFFAEEKIIAEGEPMMTKSFDILKKKAGLTRDAFLQYWLERHGPLAAKMIPGRRKYVQCHPLPVRIPGIQFEIDGVAEFGWDNPKAFQNYMTWRKSDEAKMLIEDEEKFLDKRQTNYFFGEQKVITKR